MPYHARVIVTFIFLLLLSLPTLAVCEDTQNTSDTQNDKNTQSPSEQVERLIEQLGSASYAEREQAEATLLEYHIEAFEPLIRAREHNDPEIAARARYLVRQIQVNLVKPDDSPKVAALMRNIFTLEYQKQGSRIAELATLPDGEGLGALCRLIRFSESETSAKMGAVGIMQSRLYSQKDYAAMTNNRSSANFGGGNFAPNVYQANLFNGSAPLFENEPPLPLGEPLDQKRRDEVRHLLETCQSPAATLVRAWFDFSDAKTDAEKKTAYEQWDQLCRQEEKLILNFPGNTTPAILSFLLDAQMNKAIELKLGDDAQIELVRRQLQRTHFWNRTNYKEMIDRLINEKIWEEAGISIPEFGALMTRAFQRDILPRFFCLLIQSGKEKQADELFSLYDKSFPAQGTAKADFHLELGMLFRQEGFYDRAIAQLKAAMETENLQNVRTPERLTCWHAFSVLADLYSEQGKPELSAEITNQAIQKIESFNLPDALKERTSLLTNKFKSQAAYYEAISQKNKGNETEYRKLLNDAINLDSNSVDVLIECYHLPVTPQSKAFHDRIVGQINKTFSELSQPTQNPNDREEAANVAAWLVVKTEGNLDQAIQLLETTSPRTLWTNAGYLDTLALCYLKKGDVEKAASLQRDAVSKNPHDARLLESWSSISAEYEKKFGKKPEPPLSGPARFRMILGLSTK